MERKEMASLKKWKASTDRKPLIIRGARQVGKTWLLQEFGRKEYQKLAYVNFESSAALRDLFRDNFDIPRILAGIQIETGVSIEAENTLIVFDEIQEAPGAITSLKYFQENAPEYHVVSAGSLLGVALHNHTSFPVGKVEFLDLHPLTFIEFLEALGEKPMAQLLKSPDWPLIKTFRSKYTERLRQYFFIGGMPEAVRAFSIDANFQKVREIQNRILIAYQQDFSKHAPYDIVPRIRLIWESIPAQLAKENRKFIYNTLRQGARAKDFEMAISWLIDCGLVHKVTRVSKPAIPLKAYEEGSMFKLFVVDLGLLSALTNLDAKTLLEGNSLFEEFKGALTEQYVLQQLLTHKDLSIHYWAPHRSTAELDFLIQSSGHIIPLEVKAAENLQSKSLRVFCQKYKPETAIRTSMADYRKESWMTSVPLYAIDSIF